MQKERASKYRGVYRCGSKWKSQVQIKGVQHYLGIFDTEEDAAEQYLMFQARRRDRTVSLLSEYTYSDPSPRSEQLHLRYNEHSEPNSTLLNIPNIMAGRLLVAASQLRMQLVEMNVESNHETDLKRLELEGLLLRIDEILVTLSRQNANKN